MLLLLIIVVIDFLGSLLNAILDGRVSPIHLDSVYTFSQGEWARGSVFFRKGFDLPVGGTIYLGIDGGFVNGPINLNGGTLTLEKPLFLQNKGFIVASGFIRGTIGKPDSMLIKYEGTGLWDGPGTIKIIQTSMTFEGNSSTMDHFNITIDLREAGPDIFFVGGTIVLRGLRTSSTTPARIWFINTDIFSTDSFSIFNNPEIYFGGNVSLTTLRRSVTLKNMLLLPFTKMVIYPGVVLNLNQISLPFVGTRLEVRQASLDFRSTSTAFLRMITPYTHNNQGTLSFDGTCKLSCSTNNKLVFDKYAKLELLAGARLELKTGTKILFE